MKFLNLTPHDVIVSNGALKIHFEKDPSVQTARVEQVIEEKSIDYEITPGMTLSIPVNVVSRTTVYNLPEPQEGVIYICSSMVATYVKRPDVVAPITDASCERDANGRVLSVKGLQTFQIKSIDEPKISEEPNPWVDIPKAEPKDGCNLTKVNMDMLDPIKAAAIAKAKEKYMKRVGRA